MRLHPGLVPIVAVLSALALPAAAHAAGVAYIETEPGKTYGQVWLSSLDGLTKVPLTPLPDDPPDQRWTAVAQGDGGHIIAVRNKPGFEGVKTFAVWQPDGTLSDQGPLQNVSGYSLNTLPLSLDITPDGKSMVYGYSNSRFTTQYEFARGFVPQSVKNRTLGDPLETAGYEWPTLVGNRVVAWSSGQISVQDEATSNPYAGTFSTWIPINPAFTGRRTDVAANGKVAAFELYQDSTEAIAMFPVAGVGGPITPVDYDCFLPTVGNGKDASLLQDASKIAYVDDGGLKIAPVTDFANKVMTCDATGPITTISANGRFPSLGPIDVVAIKNARTPPPPPVVPSSGGAPTTPGGTPTTPGGTPTSPGGTTTPPSGSSTPPPAATVPTTAKTAALGQTAGVPVTVTVAKAGKVSLVLTVSSKTLKLAGRARTITVATGAGTAKAKGRLTIKLKATAAGRKVLSKLKGKALTLRITAGGRTTTKTVRLR